MCPFVLVFFIAWGFSPCNKKPPAGCAQWRTTKTLQREMPLGIRKMRSPKNQRNASDRKAEQHRAKQNSTKPFGDKVQRCANKPAQKSTEKDRKTVQKKEKIMDYKALGKKLIDLVGGTENIRQLTHCATRLRFEFYDMGKVKTKEIESQPGVISVVEKGGQFQVIIGNEVQTAFRAIKEEMKEDGNSSEETQESTSEKKGIVNEIISVISTTFTPVIPALIGGGMIKAVLSILVLAGLVKDTESTYTILSFISDAPFYFMPVLLAYGASLKFKCSPIMAMTMACALLSPTWSGIVAAGESVDFFKIPTLLVDYSYSVIPIILSVWILSYVEKFAEKYSPSVIKFFLKPMIIMFIAIPIALIVVGPLGNLLNDLVQSGANFLNDRVSWLIPMLMGAFQPFLTLTGTAWAMTPIATSQISTLGYEIVNGPGMLASNIAQGGATLAVAMKTKDKNLKQLASSSGFTAVMGITEPCLYGVLLKLKRPFVASMIGGAIGGIYAGLSGLVRYAFVSPGLTAIPAFIGENPMNVVHAVITIIISFVAGFAASWILGFKDEGAEVETDADGKSEADAKKNADGTKDEEAETATTNTTKKDEKASETKEVASEVIGMPVSGKADPLSEVNDTVFSGEVLGKGGAIFPEEGKVYAPADGTVTLFFDTGHAIGMCTENGTELLIHVGIDTVNLEGKYFEPQVTVDTKVKKGDLLLKFDLEAIKAEGYDTVIPVIVTNTADFKEVSLVTEGAAKAGEDFLSVKRGE